MGNVQLYVSWVKGLPEDREALGLLRNSGCVSGVELSNVDEQFYRIKDAGLMVSSHTPGMAKTLNLARPGYTDVFGTAEGNQILKCMCDSDAPVIGFHLGYSAGGVVKMYGYPNVPRPGTLITDRGVLLNRLVENYGALEKTFRGYPGCNGKTLVLETLDFSREQPVSWDKQKGESLEMRQQIEKIVGKYGINAGILYVTEPDFVEDVLEKTGAGFCFDIGHVFISADTKRHSGTFSGSMEDYVDRMVNASNGRTRQVHLTVPGGDDERGYADHHNIIKSGDALSDRIMDLTKRVVEKSPSLSVVTLEMRTEGSPTEHAKIMVEQAEYVAGELGLSPVRPP